MHGNDTQQVLTSGGVGRWRKEGGRMEGQSLGYISLREHIERKKYSYSLL